MEHHASAIFRPGHSPSGPRSNLLSTPRAEVIEAGTTTHLLPNDREGRYSDAVSRRYCKSQPPE